MLLAGCCDDTTPTATRYATAMKRIVDLDGLPGAIASVRVPGDAEWTQASGFADVASATRSDPRVTTRSAASPSPSPSR